MRRPSPSCAEYFPDIEVTVRRGDEWPVDLDTLFETALSPSLALRESGSLHIDETRAATMIDVDTGSPAGASSARAALAANRAAARLVAQELRQRNTSAVRWWSISSGSERRDHREQVLAKRSRIALAADDPAKNRK